jgi:hypothetical protein
MEKKAWRLIFAEGLLENYINGEATWTFRIHRPGSNDFTKGQIIEGHFKDGCMLLLEVLEEPIVKPFNKITAKERAYWNHGRKISHEEMMDVMNQHNPGVAAETTASLIKLRLAQIDGRPIAGPLPELP